MNCSQTKKVAIKTEIPDIVVETTKTTTPSNKTICVSPYADTTALYTALQIPTKIFYKLEPGKRGRKKVYASNNERLRAFRMRQRLQLENVPGNKYSKIKKYLPRGGAREGAGRKNLNRSKDEKLNIRRLQRYQRKRNQDSDDPSDNAGFVEHDHRYAANMLPGSEIGYLNDVKSEHIEITPELYSVYEHFQEDDLQEHFSNNPTSDINKPNENMYIKPEPLDENNLLECRDDDPKVKLEPPDEMEDLIANSTYPNSDKFSNNLNMRSFIKSEPELIINDSNMETFIKTEPELITYEINMNPFIKTEPELIISDCYPATELND